MADQDRILRINEVSEVTGLGRNTIYGREREGRFPRRRDLGGGVVGWLSSEIQDWITSRPVAGETDGQG